MAVRFGIIFFITDDKTKELRLILEHKKECNRAVIYNTPKVFESESR
ncbi:hypothetical protein [Helicobacter pylori]|nr:hypothetical protein [Helicobacter pylori]